jgi:TatD DNase family protein
MAKTRARSEADSAIVLGQNGRMYQLIDSHCHFDAAEFDPDRDAVLQRAAARGVSHLVVPAVDAASWPALARLCAASPRLHPAYGLHPMCLDSHRPEHLDELRQRLVAGDAVAVGECGLDFFVEGLDIGRQQYFLDAQLHLAREFDLPVILHARRAVDAVIGAVRRVGGLRGVVHSFSGSLDQARVLWREGFCVGIGGPVTFERAQRLRRVVAALPAEQLLLESDAPDQPPQAHRGQRNSPEFLDEVLEVVATLRGETPQHVARTTRLNTLRLFGLGQSPDG